MRKNRVNGVLRRRMSMERLEDRRLLAVNLVADIHAGAADSDPVGLTAFRGGLVYSAVENDHGREVWVAGPDEHTKLLSDINPGPESSNPSDFTVVADKVFFLADDGTHGRELWKSDGTPRETSLVKDLEPGDASSVVTEMVGAEDQLVFAAKQGLIGSLWISDGSDVGTHLVREFDPANGGGSVVSDFAAVESTVFFTVRWKGATELWRTDGTEQGTFLLTGITTGSISQLTPVGGELFFRSNEAIWRSNGTAEGTVGFVEPPNPRYSEIRRLADLEDGLGFRTCSHFNAGDCRTYRTDIHSGETIVAHANATFGFTPSDEFQLLPFNASPFQFLSGNTGWAQANGTHFVAGNRRIARGIRRSVPDLVQPLGWEGTGTYGIWQSDLTVEGTQLIQQAKRRGDLGEVVAANGKLYFAMDIDELVGKELYELEPVPENQRVQFAAELFRVSEGGHPIGSSITVTRSDPAGNHRVAVQVYLDSATDEIDIVGYAGNTLPDQRFVLEFEEGELSKTIPIAALSIAELAEMDDEHLLISHQTDRNAIFTLRDDQLVEPPEIVRLRLWPISSNLQPSEIAEATIEIVDDDDQGIDLEPTDVGTKVVVGGAVDTISVRLNFRPDDRVVVVPHIDERYVAVTPLQLEFSRANWHRPRLIQIKGLSPTIKTQLTMKVDDSLSDQSAHEVADESIEFAVEAPVVFEEVSPRLKVANINTETTIGLQPRQLNVAGDLLFFSADDGVHGRELWRTDGTSAGTNLVKDIVAGQGDGIQAPPPFEDETKTTAVVNDVIYFVAGEPEQLGLWKSDGTAAGTTLVAEIPERPREMLAVNGKIFMSIGRALWVSDGTSAGTIVVANTKNTPRDLTEMGGLLYFSDFRLWVSDGTQSGTRLVLNIITEHLTNIDGTLFFAGELHDGVELWKTDGTREGTVQVRDISPGNASSHPDDLTNLNGTLYFRANGFPWKSDGTSRGTVRVDSIGGDFFVFQDRVFVDSGGIRDISDNQPLSADLFLVGNMVITDEFFYFAGLNHEDEFQLWKSDGAPAGTAPVSDVQLPRTSVLGFGQETMILWNGLVYFVANDGVTGFELWVSDGTARGTRFVYDQGKGGDSNPRYLANINGSLYFTADDGLVPTTQLWKADGNHATLLVVLPSPTSKEPKNFLHFRDEFVFTRYSELWKSDGTSEGTRLLRRNAFALNYDDFSHVYNTVTPYSLIVFDDTLYFEKGRYDGKSVKSLPTDGFSLPHHFFSVDERIFFTAVDDQHGGRQLWVTSDAFQSSTLLKNSEGGSIHGIRRTTNHHPQATGMAEFDSALYFTAGADWVPDSFFLQELWRSDGTSEGTRLVVRIDRNHITSLVASGGNLFFTSEDWWQRTSNLWVTDGTETVLLRQFEQLGKDFVSLNGVVYFAADAGDRRGMELWQTDGTEAGTKLAADIIPGPAGSAPGSLVRIGDRLVFSGVDIVHGREVFVSDGTQAGTRLLADIFPGEFSSNPDQLTAVDELLYLVADDGTRGRALWQVDISLPNELPGDANGDAEVNIDDFLILSANFGRHVDGGKRDGDLDRNGKVDFADFLQLSAQFGRRSPSAAES